MGRERLRGRQGVGAARTNRHDAVVGFDEVAVARQQIRRLPVHDDEHGLEAAQDPVAAPILGELDGGALEVAAILLELRLEPREKREGIGGRAREAGEDAVVVKTPDLARASA